MKKFLLLIAVLVVMGANGLTDENGVTLHDLKIHTYDEPKVFEDNLLRMKIYNVGLNGNSDIVITNKTEDFDNYIYSVLFEVNGYKEFEDMKRYPVKVRAKNGRRLEIQSPIEKIEQYPKIINKRTTFKRQITVNYEYKGKKYTFKTPVMTEDYEVECDDRDAFGNLYRIGVDCGL